jgi:hypothetical protein
MKPMMRGACHALFTACLAAATCSTALAGAPLPYDALMPAPDSTIVMLYDEFAHADSSYGADGNRTASLDVKTNISIARIAHNFRRLRDGSQLGVQLLLPYVQFLGTPTQNGHALSYGSGFAEPEFSAYAKLLNDPATGQVLTAGLFLSPPMGSYEVGQTLNASSNNWVSDVQVGYLRRIARLAGGRSLALNVWCDAYFYGPNSNVEVATPHGRLFGTTRTRPAGRLLVYLPYYFRPRTAGYIGLRAEQTFGGAQYFEAGGRSTYTGKRNEVTRLGLVAGTRLGRRYFMQASLSTDVRVRSGAGDGVDAVIQIGRRF